MPTPEQVRGDKEQDGDAGTESGMTRTEVLWKVLVVANAWCEFLCI